MGLVCHFKMLETMLSGKLKLLVGTLFDWSFLLVLNAQNNAFRNTEVRGGTPFDYSFYFVETAWNGTCLPLKNT